MNKNKNQYSLYISSNNDDKNNNSITLKISKKNLVASNQENNICSCSDILV